MKPFDFHGLDKSVCATLHLNGHDILKRVHSPNAKCHCLTCCRGGNLQKKVFDVEKNKGFIITNENMETSVEGVYAVGDVRDKDYRQVITAVADGAIAGIAVRKYLSTK